MFQVGDTVRILSCQTREDLVGKETTISALDAKLKDLAWADIYGMDQYISVVIDTDARFIAAQLELVASDIEGS
ncbi:hypothetical protein MOA67_gp100 [Klebsiella phage KpLz-2_45]|uniref:hypothetical protein n=1 Tax=Klebsiella phage KpLz-2_45 TaxID=2698923 RepID=UPI001F12CFC5|nr:hypothetical protein MOA67_gp100 [Klebsiella phage KpLz-2_45]UKS71966.1 hypothetical protein KpLz245_1000 [Klebsiella phage KpLz-2_45]